MTLYAVWEKTKYRVTIDHYYYPGGELTHYKNTNEYVEVGSTFTPSEHLITMPTGYVAKVFYYYYQYDDGSYKYIGEKSINGGSFTVTQKMIVNIYYKPLEYTITYNANGGSGAPSSQTKTYGVSLTLSSTKPTRTYYTFQGWSTSSSATSATYSAGGSYTSNSAATLYAVWKGNTYTITYNANGGSGAPASQSYNYSPTGYTYLSSTIPTKSGYTFLGWSLSSTATSASYSAGQFWDLDNASNYTLYAVWEKTKVTMYINSQVTSVLNCRSAPVSGSVLGTYTCGTKIIGYDSDTSGWFYFIEGNCYMSKDYLSTTQETCSGSSSGTSCSGTCTCKISSSGYTQSFSCSSLGCSSSACSSKCSSLGGVATANGC